MVNFSTEIVSKRDGASQRASRIKININTIDEIYRYLPSKEQIRKWIYDTTSGKTNDIIRVGVEGDIFDSMIKSLYSKIGKSVEKYNSNTWRVPSKKGVYFYERIDYIFVRSEELGFNIIAIKKKTV